MRERLLMPTLALVTIMTALIASLGTPLIAQMVEHYGVSLQDAQWVLTMPMLTGAVVSPLLGRLGGPGRQRRLLLVSLGLVVFGLVLSTVPLGFGAMLIGRALQGIGLALAPIAMSLAREVLGAEKSLPMIANLSVANVAAAGLSYPLAALFAGLIGIPGVYAIGLVLATGTFVLVWFTIPKSTAVEPLAVDWFGAILLAAGAGALLLMLSQLHSWSLLMGALVAVGSSVLIAWWVHRSLRIREPLIDLRLAASPAVSLAHILIFFVAAGGYLMLPLVMLAGQDERAANLSIAFVGFLFIPYSLFAAFGGRLGNRLRGRVPLLTLALIGTSSYAVACVVLALWHSNVWALVVGMAIGGIGSGGTIAVVPQLIVRQVPNQATSSALSFNTLLRYIGFSAGSALCPVLVSVGDGLGDSYTLAFFVAAGFFVLSALVVLFWPGVRRTEAR